jgi:GTP-binding protein LepA
MPIRNFSIIAHIDHGKSTLSDRLLMRAGAITEREFKAQILDDMDLERERGITIKASAVTVTHDHDGERFMLNFIDTPGHVDFHYEVRKALQACEGAILVVDATQGVQAQTVANAYAALEQDLEIIPVVNKIDLPSAQPELVAEEIEQILGFPAEDAIYVSAKSGQGIDDLINALCEKLPGPRGDATKPPRALIFDSHYDDYRGVVIYVRVVDGELRKGQKVRLMGTGREYSITEINKYTPRSTRVDRLGPGEVGSIVATIKDIHDVRVGDTITDADRPAPEQLPGYEPVQQMVFCDFYPGGRTQYEDLRDAVDRLSLNDSSFTFAPESSDALGFGFRCGFLGLLHMEIVQERLEREFDVEVIQTAPTVTYEIEKSDGEVVRIDAPSQLPDPSHVKEIREPIIRMNVMVPQTYVGAIMTLCEERRGTYKKTEYIGRDDGQRVIITYDIPLAEVIYDFYDKLKSATKGYGTMDYELRGFEAANLSRVDVLVNASRVDALSMILHRSLAEVRSRQILVKLKDKIDRHLFEIPLQAAIGGKVIARETIKSMGKNVTAKCYGGDVTRKRKLLEKQKKGKARMKRVGSVDIPQEAFLAVLESGD